MSRMTMPEARVTEPIRPEEAERIAFEVYGLRAKARPLPGEYDDNFHLRADFGNEFVLKVMHPSREWEFIDLQFQALSWLRNRKAPFVPTVHGLRPERKEKLSKIAVADGTERFVWMLDYVPGRVMAEVKPHSPELLQKLGRLLGSLDRALQDFQHPAAKREFKWDSTQAGWIRDYLHFITDRRRRAIVADFLSLYESEVVPALADLRRSVIYGDANDHNVIVTEDWPKPKVSIVDFGDIHEGLIVSEPAIAAAYAILGKQDVLAAAADIVFGYHCENPLTEKEMELLFYLIGTRLAVSVVNSAHRKTLKDDDPYVTVSEAPAWEALEKLAHIHPRFAHYVFRAACRIAPAPKGERVSRWLKEQSGGASSLLDVNLRTAPCKVFDLGIGSTFLGADPKNSESQVLTEAIFADMKKDGAAFGVGRYDEARGIYNAPQFATSTSNPTDERRTIHLGIDLFVEPGTPIHAPLNGEIYLLARNDASLDYGPLVIVKHKTDAGDEFFTLYGHLAAESLPKLRVGQNIAKGEVFARVGTIRENGGWPPHLHFQVIVDLLDLEADFPGVGLPSQRRVWTALCPDPNLLLGIPEDKFPKELGYADTFVARRSKLGSNLSLSYSKHLKIVRGWMQYLYDDTGRAYLDVYNNVPLVGHSHPKVVGAVQEQIALLNTNTRYLHDNAVRYAQRLSALLPEPLRVCYFVNSGSEGNELAIRMARAHTRREDIIVLEHAYHGHTNTLIDVSPYKFNGPGGRGRKPWVHVAPLPDVYRGRYREDDPDAGRKYAHGLAEILEQAKNKGREVAAFLAETLPSVGGQIVFPPDYLLEAYKHVRAAGAVCIADEVQVGFGRLGTHFWGFETQGVVPDIVVFGKPIGNAFPLAAVMTTTDIARSFDNGMEFFSTFGGNPVACAAGLAVLDVLAEENLQDNARVIGDYLKRGLEDLQKKHAIIGDVRGLGLFLGVDLVVDRETREPATRQASYITDRLRERGILTGTDGPHHNVLKLRPPLIFSRSDADLFVATLDAVLDEDPAQACRRN
ncbi:MAG: aminotransferase class III-fold pyridoxal phosphate-dependent enzyme [Terriglobales bacterium]